MKIKDTLKILLDYYTATRHVGHTHALLDGAKNRPEAIVLFSDHSQYTGPRNTVSLRSNQPYQLNQIEHFRGIKRPLLIDNSALCQILRDAHAEIERLETEILACNTVVLIESQTSNESGYQECNERHWCPDCGYLYPYETQIVEFGADFYRVCNGCRNNFHVLQPVKEDVNNIRPCNRNTLTPPQTSVQTPNDYKPADYCSTRAKMAEGNYPSLSINWKRRNFSFEGVATIWLSPDECLPEEHHIKVIQSNPIGRIHYYVGLVQGGSRADYSFEGAGIGMRDLQWVTGLAVQELKSELDKPQELHGPTTWDEVKAEVLASLENAEMSPAITFNRLTLEQETAIEDAALNCGLRICGKVVNQYYTILTFARNPRSTIPAAELIGETFVAWCADLCKVVEDNSPKTFTAEHTVSLERILKPGKTFNLFYGENNINNQTVNVRAIVDEVWVVTRTYDMRKGWRYQVEHRDHYQVLVDANCIKA